MSSNDRRDVLHSPRYTNRNSLVADSSGKIYGWSKNLFGIYGDAIEDRSNVPPKSKRFPTREELDKELDAYLASKERSNGSDQFAEARPFSSRNDNAANNLSETGPCSENITKEDIRRWNKGACFLPQNKKTVDDPSEISSRSYRQDPKWRRGPTFQNEKTADDLSETGSRPNRRDEDGGWSSGWGDREWARRSSQDKKTVDNFPEIGSRSNRRHGDRQRGKERRSFQKKKTTEDLSENSSRRDEDVGWNSGWGSRFNRRVEAVGCRSGWGSRFNRRDEDGGCSSGWSSRPSRRDEDGGWDRARRFSSNDETADKLSETGSSSNKNNYIRTRCDENSVRDKDQQIPENDDKTITDDLPEIVPCFKKEEKIRSRKDEDRPEQIPQNNYKTITDDFHPKFALPCKQETNNHIRLDKDRQIRQNNDETITELPEIVPRLNKSENICDGSRESGFFYKDYEIANDLPKTGSRSNETENIRRECDEDGRSSQNNKTPANYRSDMSTSELLTLQERDYERKYNRRELADYGENEDHYRGLCRGTPDSLSDLALCPPWKLKPDDTRSIIDFIDQFWDRIGQFIYDPNLRLIRFNNVLAASPETRFLTYDVKEYIRCCSIFKDEGGPEFRFVEKMLRSIFWPLELQMKIAREFAVSRYDPDDEQMTKYAFVTSWYCKLMQIKPCGPEDPLRALTDKMPEEFTRWIKMKYDKCYPDTICELCVWIRRFDAPTV